MSMKPEFFCCIGAELKDEIAGSLKSSRIFMYRAAESQTIADMLVDGFFNEADDLRVNDLILLYCPEKTRAFTYAKVSSVSGGVVKTATVNIDPQDIPVDTTGYSNISGSNLKQVLDSIDAEFSKYVKKDGSSIMTAPLKFIAGSYSGAIAGGLGDGIEIYKINSSGTIQTEVASITLTNGFIPGSTNTISVGSNALKWKNLYLAGSAYISKINNGFDIAVPVTNSADTLALKSQVDLAANSGSQLYTTGVWYAKMYAATVVPTGSEYNGRKYADFSQVDSENNPVIKIYTGASGAWTLTETITPPATYNGYITVTSKIWDIAEQAGQQGGEVLWDYTHKTFTPYPKIVSFENAALTGNSTTQMPLNPTGDTIVNVDYLATHNGTGRNVGDIFFTSRTDNELNGAVECNGATYNTTDFTGAQSIGQLLANGKVPYLSLADYATALATNGSVGVFGWDGGNTTTFRVPSLNDIFIETGTAAQIGDYLPAGLPNITGTIGGRINTLESPTSSGAFATTYNVRNALDYTEDNSWTANFAFDASRSSSVYKDNVTTVQPNTVRYRAMIQLAISATDEAVMTCTNITAQVAANTSAINGADYVVETQLPTAENNYTWYRKYKSGWVEQGGSVTPYNTTNASMSLPVEMADTNYSIIGNCSEYANSSGHFVVLSKSTTGFTYSAGYTANGYWEVKGMAA